ncbi:MAG: Na+/H+ antiporter subunit E [Gammaproteobacteria bacterium]
MMRSLSLFIILFVLWLLLSGHLEPLMMTLATVSCLFVVLVSRRMDVVDHESHPLHLSLRLLHYWLWLLREIVLANAAVVREILRPRLAITPTVVTFETEQSSDLGKVILGNSITLTPGTVTLDIDGSTVTVHGLTRTIARQAADGSMDRRVPADVES